MPAIDVFTPSGTTKHISVTSTTANVALPVYTVDRIVRVHNRLSEIVWIEFGASSAIEAAVATSLPIPAGAVEFFAIGPAVTYVAAISASGSGTADFTEGLGS